MTMDIADARTSCSCWVASLTASEGSAYPPW